MIDLPSPDLQKLLKPSYAVVEKAPSFAPDCVGTLRDIKSGKQSIDTKLWYISDVPKSEGLKHFPKAEGLELPDRVVNDGEFSFLFFKYHESKKPWDVAIEYLSRNGEPRKLYYARGRITEEGTGVVHPHDVIFRFYKNPEDVSKDNVDISKLSRYIAKISYTCVTDYPKAYMDQEYNKTKPKNRDKKEKQKKKSHNFSPVTSKLPVSQISNSRRRLWNRKVLAR